MDTFAWIFLAVLSAMLGEATMLVASSHRKRNQQKLVTNPLPACVWIMGAFMLFSLPVLCVVALGLESRLWLTTVLITSQLGGGFAGIPLARWIVARQNVGRRVADRLSIIPHLRD